MTTSPVATMDRPWFRDAMAAGVMIVGGALTGLSVLLTGIALHLGGGDIGAGWLVVTLSLMGVGNGLILPPLIAAPMARVRPEQAGVASGMLATTQQFAGVTGIAVLGTVFFAALGSHPGRARFAAAAELASWIVLGIVIVMTALVTVLIRVIARPPRTEAAGEETEAVAV